MQITSRAIFVGIFCNVSMLLAPAMVEATELPCADDCISSFELLWSGDESEELKRTAINDITDYLAQRGYEHISTLRIQRERYIFVAFKKDCDRKDSVLQKLLDEAFSFLRPGVTFRLTEGRHVRGPDTIEFSGEHWKNSLCCE